MENPPELLLHFTPHVPARANTTGWTPDRQIAFIAALARTGVVRAAAESVGMSARSAYQLRTLVLQRVHNLSDVPMMPERAASLGPGYVYSFAAAWDLALARGLDFQIDASLPVALEGERVPIIRRGRVIGWQNKFNIRLALAALGAFRRSFEGSWYDHEVRTAERTHRFAEGIEALLRLGPVRWPDPEPPMSEEERLEIQAGKRAERNAERARLREERRIYGPRIAGMLDPDGPADRPPRTLAERAAGSYAERRAKRHPEPPAPPRPPAEPRVWSL